MRGKITAVLLIGPPGSGKGTQARLLAEKFGFYHFMTSQVLKEYFENHNDPDSVRQRELYRRGDILDPKWVFGVVKEKTENLVKRPEIKGIVYDGSPRTLYEAERLFPLLDRLIGAENVVALEIEVSEDEIKRRLGKRLVCAESEDHIFIKSEKFQPGDKCPECGGILKERDLDKKEIIQTRIEEYREHTLPAIDYLRKNHRIIVIDGEQSIEDVHKEIIARFSECRTS